MPTAQGTRQAGFILIGGGATPKTLPATITADKVPIVNPNFRPVRNEFRSNALTGTPEPRAVVPGKVGAEWDVRAECNPSALDPWMAMLMGVREQNGTAALYSKRYYLGDQVERHWEDSHSTLGKFLRYLAMYSGAGSFSFAQEGQMEASFSGKALKVLASAVSTAINSTITDRTPFIPFSYLYGRVKRNGTTLGYVKVATLDINRNLGWDSSQDETNEMALAFSEVATINGTITALFQDATLYDDAINNVQVALELFVPYGSGQGFQVILPACYLKPFSVRTNGTGLITLEGGFEAQGIGTTTGAVYGSFVGTSLALNTLTLQIQTTVAGSVVGGTQTITFTATETTPDLVVTKINATLANAVARVLRMAGETGGVVVIETNASGSLEKIQVTGGTAVATLGFDAALHAGLSNVHGEYWLFNKVA